MPGNDYESLKLPFYVWSGMAMNMPKQVYECLFMPRDD